MLSKFTDSQDRLTLKKYIDIPDIYSAGRLDKDSEGLLLLTDNGKLNQQISHPEFKMEKIYFAQVEGIPDEKALLKLTNGVYLKDGLTLPAKVKFIPEPNLWERDPPIRFRKYIPTTWIKICIKEGKNRQVRRMTAAVGYPTLRLVRWQIGPWSCENLLPGQWQEISLSDKDLKRIKILKNGYNHR